MTKKFKLIRALLAEFDAGRLTENQLSSLLGIYLQVGR